ncbi:MAG: acyl-CoA dehydrogenase family protein, partial [Spirochaetia bacterium]|nr:acyl-CoA dehydrogenase family protein [Spirochaetia bacterium]
TERVGGSNVGANRTVARRGENGKWILNGEKWFCSNPGDLWVTTARIEGTSTIGLFLVPRIKDDGTLNGCHLLRKKDIIGSRGKVTAEASYENAEAEELGRPSHGLANLIRYVIKTSRVHVSVSAAAHGRRAYMEALAYAKVREAYGRRLIQFPVVLRNLAEMHILQSAITLTAFRNFKWAKDSNPIEQIVTPLLKLISTQQATWMTHEAIMIHGGNGILGDFSILPRLHNDAIINETWEGTHNIIGEHTLKALSRPKSYKALESIMTENLSQGASVPGLEPARAYQSALWLKVKEMLEMPELWVDSNRLVICDALYGAFALSELIREAGRDGAGSVLVDFANGFGEIMERGKLGPAKKDGVFVDQKAMERIVAY